MVFTHFDYKPFEEIRYYSKNYRNSGKNRENIIYYYLIKTDKNIDLNNTNYDEYELDGNYQLKYVKLSQVKEILLDSIEDNQINKIIVKEMLGVLENSGLIKEITY